MITVESFRQKIRESQSESLLDEVLLAPEAIHIAAADIEHIKAALVRKFDATTATVEIWVVGSAKLGFSITEKRLPGGAILPRYRTFSPTSDVDLAVVSSSIFDLIWNERYNDDFPLENEINVRIQRTLDFIEECGFSPKCRVWRKADLFTLIIELDQALSIQGLEVQPSVVVESLENFYSKIDTNIVDPSGVSAIYYKSALQASNDRINRVRRGVVILGILKQSPERDIRSELVAQGLFHETESDLLSGISEAS